MDGCGTVLVSPVSIHKGDFGFVIVGGREFNRLKPEENMSQLYILHVHICTTLIQAIQYTNVYLATCTYLHEAIRVGISND